MLKTRTTWIRGDADVAKAVALTTSVAREAGLDPRRVSAVSTAASEVSRNIVKYAGSGQFTIAQVEEGNRSGVRFVARDRGPGIGDVSTALQDHYSTGGTLGLGLPGVKRLMDDLQVESTAGKGTTVTGTMWAPAPTARRPRAATGPAVMRSPHARNYVLASGPADGTPAVLAAARVRPHRSERVSGDGVVLRWIGTRVLVGLIDGLGHGPAAADIAARAGRSLAELTHADVAMAMEDMHEVLGPTDGAAAAVAVIDPGDGSYQAAAIGNVRVRISGAQDTRLDWTEGTLGAHYRTPALRRGKLGRDTMVIYSDGISDRFSFTDYAGIRGDDPAIAARNVVDRFGKDHDDASCIVVRLAR